MYQFLRESSVGAYTQMWLFLGENIDLFIFLFVFLKARESHDICGGDNSLTIQEKGKRSLFFLPFRIFLSFPPKLIKNLFFLFVFFSSSFFLLKRKVSTSKFKNRIFRWHGGHSTPVAEHTTTLTETAQRLCVRQCLHSKRIHSISSSVSEFFFFF